MEHVWLRHARGQLTHTFTTAGVEGHSYLHIVPFLSQPLKDATTLDIRSLTPPVSFWLS